MGIGDELIVAGEARGRAAQAPGTKYLMLDKKGNPKWHWIWKGNPDVAPPGTPHNGTIAYVNGTRPYIESLTPERYTFREYEPQPAFIAMHGWGYLAARAAGCVVFNPTVKVKAPPNKDWGIEKWRELVASNKDIRWLQIGEAGPRIEGAQRLQTLQFMEAIGVLSGADAVVCHEGALHHAAAALDVPAVVIRGGFISPRVTGYRGQANLYVEDDRWPLGCGMRKPCAHCIDAMESIEPDDVMQALKAVMKEKVAA